MSVYIPGNIRVVNGSWLKVETTMWELVHMLEYLQTPVLKKGVHNLFEFAPTDDTSTKKTGLCTGNSSKSLFQRKF